MTLELRVNHIFVTEAPNDQQFWDKKTSFTTLA